jgi:RNA polymerase sigma factor (sigma-70 family)
MNFEEFWKLHYRRLVLRLIKETRLLPQDVEELAADALNKSWPRIQQSPPAAQWVYVLTAGLRAAINHRRNAQAQRRDAARTTPLEDFHDRGSSSGTPENMAIARQEVAHLAAKMKAALAELPEETRLYIVMRRRDQSYQQIADRLGVTIAAVQSRLHRATNHFNEHLGPPPGNVTWIEIAGELIDDHEK